MEIQLIRMVKNGWIVLFGFSLLLAAQKSFSQQNKIPQSVFIEGLGSGIFYSFNFDTRFTPNPHGWGGRAGIGFTAIDGDRLYTVPVVINYLIGNKRNFLWINRPNVFK